jgi:hypothetical protein
VLSFRASPNAFAPSAPISLPISTPSGGGKKNTNSGTTVQIGGTASKVITTSALDKFGSVDRASPQSTCNSPPSGALHTQFNKRKPPTQITSETKTTHLANSATTKSAWCCPSERRPTPSFLLRRFHSLQTHPTPSDGFQIRIQQTSSNELRCRQGNHSDRSKHTRYMTVLNVVLHTRLAIVQPVTRSTHFKENQKHKTPTKPRLLTSQTQ